TGCGRLRGRGFAATKGDECHGGEHNQFCQSHSNLRMNEQRGTMSDERNIKGRGGNCLPFIVHRSAFIVPRLLLPFPQGNRRFQSRILLSASRRVRSKSSGVSVT